jgi:hypothetical protein
MAKYMFLLRSQDDPGLSPTQMQQIVEEYTAWARRLRSEGSMLGGNELKSASKLITGAGIDLRVTDGPFAETKEAIGGYFLIEADDEQKAVEIATQCPGLKRRGTVEVHEIVEH